MSRAPDSRANAGQRLEDELDQITDSMRRDTRTWVKRMMRGHPGRDDWRGAIISGIAGGLLDELLEMTDGDMGKVSQAWAVYAAAYADAADEDQAADAETGA